MNRIWRICIAVLLFAGIFTGCTAPEKAEKGHLVTPSGISVSIGEDGSGIEARFGKPKAYAEAQSCYGKGLDKVYTYDGFEITTYPAVNGKSEFISVLTLTDDTAETGLGLKIGMPKSSMVELYGEDYALRGQSCVYTFDDGVTLWVDLAEETIARIEFLAP